MKEGVISGPFSLRYLHLFISKRSPGAFILSRKGRYADFVGSTPDDVAGALGQFVRQSSYRYFWFAYASSADEAFRLEGTWYHRFHPTDNPAPPSQSHGESWRCTKVGCTACALAETRR